MIDTKHNIEVIEKWYKDNCNGDWEHTYGIHIGTLDNPGWRLDIDLSETELEEVVHNYTLVERTTTNWVGYKIENQQLMIRGGLDNFQEILEIAAKFLVEHKITSVLP